MNLNKSRELQKRAESLIPGGVNSPARAFRSVGGDPPFVVRAEGAYIWDADGNNYVDYVGSWGPMILGHAFPSVVNAIQEAAAKSPSFGASTSSEADLADIIVKAFPSIEKLRFVNSGTEAAMSAIRVARAFTKREYVIKFEGCYHGHSDGLLVKGGSGLATLGTPDSAGVPQEITQFTISLPYNRIAAVEEAFENFKDKIACVIVEPVGGNMGCVPPQSAYLRALREITHQERSILIFDEVMTGFRIAFGGAQERWRVSADMTCLGKIIGGGLPVGAYGGRAQIMDLVAPLGPVYQAGTLSGNPLAMAAGLATLTELRDKKASVYPQLEQNSERLVAGVCDAAGNAGVKLTANRVGSMFTWFFNSVEVRDWTTADKSDRTAFGKFHRAMLEQGVWLPPSQFEAAFLSTAHGASEIEQTIAAAGRALAHR